MGHQVKSRDRSLASQRTHRKLLKIHQIVGLKLSIFMTFVLFTGTLAIFSDELDWLLNHKIRVNPQTTTPLSLGQLTDIALDSHPDFQLRRAEIAKSSYHAAAFLAAG